MFRLSVLDDENLAKVANIQSTIAAIDDVIEKGDLPRSFDPTALASLSKL